MTLENNEDIEEEYNKNNVFEYRQCRLKMFNFNYALEWLYKELCFLTLIRIQDRHSDHDKNLQEIKDAITLIESHLQTKQGKSHDSNG